jgi:serine/threonine protein kinase
MQDLTGQTLDRYLITGKLGMGGMAAVFKAYQPTLDRYVAIKVLHPIVASDEKFLARFRREARAAASLRHPHIVQIYDFGNDGDRYYMAMEYVEGLTLKQRLDEVRAGGQHMPLDEAVRIISQVADALYYAHEIGMVHRDVKPANILLDDRGRAVLSDFGIVHMMEGTRYTLSSVLGTPHYMSPEQGMDQTVDARSDIYSLGAVLYEMLTGQVPFSADTLIAVIFKHVQEPLPPPRSINPDLPAEVEQVVVKAMAKSPADRFTSAREMAAALLTAVVQSTPFERDIQPFDSGAMTPILSREPVRPPAARPTPEPQRRRFRLTASNAFVVGSLLALVGVALIMLVVSANMAPTAASVTATAAPPGDISGAQVAGSPAVTLTTDASQMTAPTLTPKPPPPTPTPRAVKTPAAAAATATPTPTPAGPTFRYRAPALTAPISGSIVAGPIIFLKWEPIERLQAGEWYAVRLMYFKNGQPIYEGDNVTAPEWRVPESFYHQADGPELRYEWYVYVERETSDGSTEPLSPQSEHSVFRWE